MAMSSGKSSSMAAVLLVVAVVAGTCASGAQAEFSIKNLCDKIITLRTNTSKYPVTRAPDTSLNVNVPLKQFFTSPVTFTFERTPNPLIRIPPTALDRLNQPGEKVLFIEIRCEGFCFTLVVVYTLPPNPLVKQYVLGPFCPGP